MALEVYFRDDIANVLRAAQLDGGAPPDLVKLIGECDGAQDIARLAELTQAFQHGYSRALQKVGASFGIFVDS